MRRLLCFGILVLAAATLSGQQPDQSAPPDFRSSTDTVRIDIRAVDASGRFVDDLQRDEIRILDNGREQTLATFAKIDIPQQSEPVVRPANVATNLDFRDGRIYVLFLDDAHLHPLRRDTVRELAHRFVDRALGPNDRIALTTASGHSTVAQEFTSDRTRLHAVIDRFQAYDLPPMAHGPDATVMRSLRQVVEWLGVATERRKAIVFISEGIPYDFHDAFNDPGLYEGGFEAREMLAAAARANVNIYTVSPMGQPGAPYTTVRPVHLGESLADRVWRECRDSLIDFARHTGGESLVLSNAFDEMFDRIVDESSRYYMAGYTLTAPPKDNKFHEIEVRVTRPGVTVKARTGYITGTAEVPKRARPPKELPVALGETLQSPLPIPDVPLTISTNITSGTPQSVVDVLVEAPEHQSPLDVLVVAVEPGGKSRGMQRLTLTGGQGSVQLPLKKGRYHLRVAAVEQQSGRRGSVLHDFEVPAATK